jgi:hypothetical protein
MEKAILGFKLNVLSEGGRILVYISIIRGTLKIKIGSIINNNNDYSSLESLKTCYSKCHPENSLIFILFLLF